MLAAYTCTPLVKVPVSELKAGAHVKGTTIAELGNRNKPLDMIMYQKDGKDYLLMTNSSRGVMKIPTEGAGEAPGITAASARRRQEGHGLRHDRQPQGRAADGPARQDPCRNSDQVGNRRCLESRDDRVAVIAGPLYLTYLLAYGAVMLVERAASSEVGAPAEYALEPDEPVKPRCPSIKVAWELPADPKSGKAWVNVSGVDTSVLSVLQSADMTASRWSSFFAVRVAADAAAQPGSEEAPPLWGKYEIHEKVIRFVPRFRTRTGHPVSRDIRPGSAAIVLKELTPSPPISESKTARATGLSRTSR